MDAADLEAAAGDELLDARRLLFVQTEDEDAVVLVLAGLVLLEQLDEAVLLVVLLHDLDFLRDAGVGAQLAGGVVADGDLDGVLHEGGREVADRRWPGGGEHDGLLAGCGGGGDDLADLLLETLVQHAVGLVEDHVLDLGEVDGAFLDVVVETSGSGDHDVCAVELDALGILGHTAVDDGDLDVVGL